MVKTYHVILLLITLYTLSACNTTTTPEQLQQQVSRELAGQQGVFAVAFKNLATGETLFINEKEVFHAASTMKTPVLLEIYKQDAAGTLSVNDSIVVKNEFKSIVDSSTYSLSAEDDSDKELYKHIGEKRTISSLLYDMIIVSSNLATNMIIELANAEKVTQTMRELGAQDIQVLRGVEDSKAFAKGLNNTTTAYDLLVLFEKMARGETVSPAASQAMINILLDQEFNDIIPALLPKEVKVAHKTGEITGVRHDCGIIFLPDSRKYVLVLLSKKLDNPDAGIEAMANVSEMIYKYMMK